MAADFDHIAPDYDVCFTHTPIGRAQRNVVFAQLDQMDLDLGNLKILELNCGTGEDALQLGEKGAHVLATDISPEMVQQASLKNTHLSNVHCELLDITKLDEYRPTEKFDLILSNFGGLNCLDATQMKFFLQTASQRLTNNGKLVLVIMPEFCAWESIYFLTKFKFAKVFRRKNKNGVLANVDGKAVKTYYYSPLKMVQWAHTLKLHWIAPVGLFIPPSYLNPFFANRQKTIDFFQKRDEKASNSFHLSGFSDHYLISLTAR